MLSAKQQAHFQRYVDLLRTEYFRMTDWDISVEADPADSENYAQIEIVKGQRRAALYVARLFPYESPGIQRHFIVHELVHACMRDLPDAIAMAEKPLGSVAWSMLADNHERAEENATDMIAGILAPLVPLPPKTKDNGRAMKV